MLPTDILDSELRTLMGLIDAALPECYWKRLFNLTWLQTKSIDIAFEVWSRGPIVNQTYFNKVVEMIAEIKLGYSLRRAAQR